VAAAADRRAQIWSVIRASSGNFLEAYDFTVFGYYAVAIGHVFFPTGSAFAQLMAAFMTFGAGFLVRPLGAIVLGAYFDHHGRRAGLLLTLGLMAIGTLSIALTPGFATLGWVAPAIIVLGRLIQGFSAGGELGGVAVYLSEIATPGHKGFYVALQSASIQVSVIFMALVGVALGALVPPESMQVWGWRIPFLIGCLIIPLLFALRRSLQETDEFEQRRHSKHHPTPKEIFRSLARNWRVVLIGTLMVTTTTVLFYFITAYTPTFGKEVLKLSGTASLLVTLCVGISNLFWLPVMGAISDQIGRRPLLILFSVLTLLTAYPALASLAGAPSFGRLLAVELWLSFLYGSYNGAMLANLTEIMPVHARSAGFCFAFSLATALFGGFTPAISTTLIGFTGNRAMPAAWLCFAAACGLAAALMAGRERFAARQLAPAE
jgi:MFS transporter, MHS family, citrate/tricarballylate:H+ symporter